MCSAPAARRGYDCQPTTAQRAAIVAAAAELVGLISLFNAVGRVFWASLSDKIGRKNMYYTIFILGIILYCLLPTWGHLGLPTLFALSICIILSMYGGGFATVPAYLADIFGPQMVGAIRGRLITAWSVAGVVGPALIAGLRQFEIDHGVAHNLVYDITLYIMATLLFGDLVCNFFIKPVHEKQHMSDDELARERALLREDRVAADAETGARGSFGIGRCWSGSRSAFRSLSAFTPPSRKQQPCSRCVAISLLNPKRWPRSVGFMIVAGRRSRPKDRRSGNWGGRPDRFADRCGVHRVVLVALDVSLHPGRRHQLDLMA